MREDSPDLDERMQNSQKQQQKIDCPFQCDELVYPNQLPDHIADEHSD